MTLRRALFAILLALTAPAVTQESSLTPDESYVKAMAYAQREISTQKAAQAQRDIKQEAGNAERRRRLTEMQAEFRRLRDESQAQDNAANAAAARATLLAFAEGRGVNGVQLALARAAAMPEGDAAQKTAKAGAYQRAAMLAATFNVRDAVPSLKKAVALTPGDLKLSVEIARAYGVTGDLTQAETAYRAVLETPGISQEIKASVVNDLGIIALIRNDLNAAQTYFMQAYEINKALDRKDEQGDNLGNIGLIADAMGETQVAVNMQTRALALHQEAKNNTGVMHDKVHLALLAMDGNPSLAAALLQEALGLAVELDDKPGQSGILGNLALVANPRDAKGYYDRALKIQVELGYEGAQALTYINLTQHGIDTGDLEGAADALAQARKLALKLKDKRAEALVLGKTGLLQMRQSVAQGTDAAARSGIGLASTSFNQALKIAQQIGARDVEAESLYHLALLADILGQKSKACQYAGRAFNIYTTINMLNPTVDQMARQFCNAY